MIANTAESALICINALAADGQPRSSPLYTVMTMAKTLEFDPAG